MLQLEVEVGTEKLKPPEDVMSSIEMLEKAQIVGPNEVERLAYTYWEARGCPIGSPDEDWYRAELVLRERARADDVEDLQALSTAAV